MLKYLDIARLVGAGIKCTACNGTRCRQSRWDSKHEKLSNQSAQPYRCEDCGNRFLAARGASLERTLINSTAYVILGLGGLTAAEYWLGSNDNLTPGPVELGSAVGAEERATRNPEGGEAASRIGKEPSDADEYQENLTDNVALLQKAATKGHVGAMIHLGQILATGEKYPKDTQQAAKWMQLAAATGNPEGMFELGRYYRDGVGLPQNHVRAYVWLNRAATAKHLSAIHERDDLIRTMNAEELREAHNLALSEDWRDNTALLKR